MSFNAKNTSGILLISKLKLTIIFVIVVVMSFSWQIENFHAHFAALMEERGDPLTSEQFQKNGYTWRAILTKDLNLYLQLVSASFPATVEIR